MKKQSFDLVIWSPHKIFDTRHDALQSAVLL